MENKFDLIRSIYQLCLCNWAIKIYFVIFRIYVCLCRLICHQPIIVELFILLGKNIIKSVEVAPTYIMKPNHLGGFHRWGVFLKNIYNIHSNVLLVNTLFRFIEKEIFLGVF